MFKSVRTYICEKRQSFTRTAGVVGGVYLVGQYVWDRLEETKEAIMQERLARDNLRRRFHQNQENISYTTMALVSTLSEQIMDGMNVENVTVELQAMSRSAAKAPLPANPGTTTILPPQQPEVSSSDSPNTTESSRGHVPHRDHDNNDLRSENGSISHSVISSAPSEDAPPHMEHSSQSWATDNLSAAVSSRADIVSLETPVSESTDPVSVSSYGLGASDLPPTSRLAFPTLADSIISTNSSMLSYSANEIANTDSTRDPSLSTSSSSRSRTKADLWNEVKVLTFTRVLTILYSTTLLSLFTNIQLTLLSRSSYIQSVLQMSREESREEFLSSISPVSLLFSSLKGFGSGGLEGLIACLDDDGVQFTDEISEEVERKFLTLSWWILHVGWKDVSERVRKGVEDTLDGVSLKSKLGIIDVHRIISDIRRRVEHEITFEGTERRVDFLSTLLPPTPEMTQRVLSEGGFFPSPSSNPHFPPLPGGSESPSHSFISLTSHHPESDAPVSPSLGDPDPQFFSLVEETRQIIASPDFAKVLEICMERAVEVLFDDLEKDVYFVQAQKASEGGVLPPGEEVRIRLAALLPGLARWSREVLNGLPNVLVDTLINTREASALSAIVFSKFEDQFIT